MNHLIVIVISVELLVLHAFTFMIVFSHRHGNGGLDFLQITSSRIHARIFSAQNISDTKRGWLKGFRRGFAMFLVLHHSVLCYCSLSHDDHNKSCLKISLSMHSMSFLNFLFFNFLHNYNHHFYLHTPGNSSRHILLIVIVQIHYLVFSSQKTLTSFTFINLSKKIEKSHVEFSQSRRMLSFSLVRRHVRMEDQPTNARRLPCSHNPWILSSSQKDRW